MEITVENSTNKTGLGSRKQKRSLEGCDSNAVILPAKRSKKGKEKDQGLEKVQPKQKPNLSESQKQKLKKLEEKVQLKQQPKLSKSQKRKLKKLEEDKEKEILLSKSIETLEKYKIPEDAYSLLRSSKSLGRAETMLEKRRRAIQFSKAGIQVPHSDRSSKERDGYSLSETESELDQTNLKGDVNKNYFMEPMLIERQVANKISDSMQSSKEPGGSVDGMPAEIVLNEGKNASFEEDNRPMSKADGIPSVDFSGSSNLQQCPLHRHITTPTVVHVSRPDEVANRRKDLPIVMMEQEIMEAINENPAVIVCGETGCGKTTQVPQFLYEAGFGSNKSIVRSGIIGVTQPRRVAVLATARRVAFELGLRLGKEVGFQVRHDKKIGENCSIKFMTDGILLREVQNDFSLKRYSVIILDEAHERSLNTDILIGMLSRVIRLRQDLYEKQQCMVLSGKTISPENRIFPLKLVLMSATLRVEDFISGGRLFHDPPPVIEVPTRQFPVTVYFSKRTEIVDYIGQAFKKVMAIHKRLPSGGILVFVTGQREVEYLCSKLRKASMGLIANNSKRDTGTKAAPSEMNSVEDINMKDINEAFEIPVNSTDQQTDRFSSYDEDQCNLDEDVSDTSYDSETESDLEIDGKDGSTLSQNLSASLVDVLGDDGSLASLKAAFEALAEKDVLKCNSERKETLTNSLDDRPEQSNPCTEKKKDADKRFNPGALRVLPLYAMLPAAAQLRVFEEVKEGERLVVVATNVAETSLTIPGIKYVVDTGREKAKNYNPTNGMETYEVQWISKASAAQRAGRAGRTGPGHCYRLYSSAVFSNILPDFSCAEISKIPVDGVVLLMKSMGIEKVGNFPFPTAPETSALVEAERSLKALEALDSNGRLTPLGKAMAYYPMSPRHSRMLLTVIQIMNVESYARPNLIFGYAVAAAAALSLSNPFVIQHEGSHTNTKDSEHNNGSDALDNERIMHKQEKQKKKELKVVAKASRAKFSNHSSDALTVAYALQCFELSKSQVEFCNENALHFKTMEEMSKLRKQLLQLVFNQNVSGNGEQDFLWTHGTVDDVEHSWRDFSSEKRLSLYEEQVLGKAICAGWTDRVAKRIRVFEGGKVKAVRYQACLVKEPVFLHHWSSLSNSAPEFLVYSELLHTKRPYVHGATRVESEWLVEYAGSLCSFSAPLTDRKPYYDPKKDQVYCWATPSFGPHLWELPSHRLAISSNEHRVAVFAFALLEGQVLPCLRSVRKFMSASPYIILKPESYGQKRVGNLLYKLKTNSIDSCAVLRKTWEANPKALHSEILDWFQEGFHKQFEAIWSQMLNEVVLEPQERFRGRDKR